MVVVAIGSVGTDPSARCTSSADAGRSSGSFAIKPATSAPSSTGTVGTSESTRGGVEWTCWYASDTASSPENGRRPTSIWNSTQPSEYRSARASTFPPVACSGAMYGGEPNVCPVRVSVASGRSKRAMPKSPILAASDGVRNTFDGFTSRCTMPRSCAAARPLAMSVATATARAGSTRPDPTSSRSSVVPSTNSITRYGRSASSPAS